MNFSNYKKINIKGSGELYEDNERNIFYSILNINESGIERNSNFRVQLSSERRDLLRDISIKSGKQLIILCKLEREGKVVYIYAPTSHYIFRKFAVRSSIWFSDKSAILDSYMNDTIEIGSEEGGSLDTICFSENKFDEAVDLIISTLPLMSNFAEKVDYQNKDFENLLKDLKKNEMIKELMGYIGEYIFYKKSPEIKFGKQSVRTLFWNYAAGDKYVNHDFRVQLSNFENLFIEVKSSSPTSERHLMSKSEIDFMENNKENYSLVTIRLNSEFMSLIYGSESELSTSKIDKLIASNNYELDIFNGFHEIRNKFNFDGRVYSLERKQ